MARTAPVPNIPAIPGMNPGTWIMGGGGGGGGGNGRAGRGRGGGQGAGGQGGGNGAQGGGKNAGACGPGSGGGCPNPSHGRGGGTSAGDPVDPVTGRVYTANVVDLALPGLFPLVIERSYSSETSDVDLGLGYGWSHSLAWVIEVRRRTLRVLAPHAAPTTADVPEPGRPLALPCGQLTRHEAGYSLVVNGLLYVLDEPQGNSWLLSRIVDRYGNQIRLVYEENRLSRVVDSVGRVVRVRRHRDGRIAAFEVKNASEQGRWTSFRTYRYSERGDLSSAIDAAGKEHRYEYDEEHRLRFRREPGGLVAEFRYTDEGRCVETWCQRPGNDALDGDLPDTLDDRQTKANGFCHVKVEDRGVFIEVITSRSTRRIEGNHLDKADKVVWQGSVHSYRYDAVGNMIEYQDALGHAWRCEHDELGRLRAEIDPLGARTEYVYDERGAVVAMQDALGGIARYERNAQGDVTAVSDELGLVAEFCYDERGLFVGATLPNGGVTRMEYDALGNRVTVVEPDGATRRIQYDFLGRVVSFTDERGLATFYTYDVCGRVSSIRRPSGATDRYDYDDDGNLSRIVDADGRATTLRWGGIGVVTEVVRPDGHAVRYFYDREQDLVRLVNEAGEEHRYVRRGEGRIVEELTFDGRRIYYRHDAMGRVIEIRDNTSHVEFVYDPCGRLAERSFMGGRKDGFVYDPLGRIVCATSGDVTCDYAYDARGRVVRETVTRGGQTTTIQTAYDALGDAVRTQGPFGTMAIARDVIGRPVEVHLGDLGPVRMAYDPAGNLVERVLPGGGRIAENVTPDGLPAWVQVLRSRSTPAVQPGEPVWVGPGPNEVTFAKRYAWSPAGLLAAAGEAAGGGHTEYARDVNGRVVTRQQVEGARRVVLEGVGHGPSGELYDSAAQRQYAPGGRIVTHGHATFAYDDRGRRVSKTLPDGRRWRFEWGDDDLLQVVSLPDGRAVRFAYDPFARRIEKRVERDRTVESITRYTWSGDVLVHETCQRVASEGAAPEVEERTYAVLPDGVTPLAERVRRNGQESFRYHVDAQNGMPEALVNGDGSLIGTVDASLFGRVEGAREALTRLRFPGQYADEETGIHYNRYRYYDPEVGQYLSPEPLRLEGSLRAYSYVDGWPVELVDIDGLMRCVITRRDGSTIEDSSGFNDPVTGRRRTPEQLHPAVQAALPPSNARGPASRTPPSGCAEPWALSRHLNDWEARNAPRTCRPEDPRWRENLRSALGEINPRGGIASTQDGVPRASCPNCSQTIPRLWALAGQMPPNGVIAPGYQGQRRRGEYGPTTSPAVELSRRPVENQRAATEAYGDLDLGIWDHGRNGWRRRRRQGG
ncbi:RHS repeat-associated core domain-containing protein [Sorangium sp. So ce1024]|uniref:RHS repeat-associated core domain-containing protein n=1 Tax=Sorangium sp. So ce1024 TaxID=3133327 RepID=UPI003F10A451